MLYAFRRLYKRYCRKPFNKAERHIGYGCLAVEIGLPFKLYNCVLEQIFFVLTEFQRAVNKRITFYEL